MRTVIFGAAGFIGTNLAIRLSKEQTCEIVVIDKCEDYFSTLKTLSLSNVTYKVAEFGMNTNFDDLLECGDTVFHLVSTTVPTTSNQHIQEELLANVVVSSKLFDACVRKRVKKVVFISSGGTVYGKEVNCPLGENTPTNPISSYGIQKVTIEKLLYLYNYMYGLDYRVIRLANPYGPYQRPNGILGAVTTFTYKALCKEPITVFGDGTVVRDYIYIDDAINGIMTITKNDSKYRTFNLGCGKGTSINELLDTIKDTLGVEISIQYKESRKVDVPINYLDISRYEKTYGHLNPVALCDGIKRTAVFMQQNYL